VGVAQESVFGTFVAPTRFVPCIPQVRGNFKIARPDQARGYRGQVVDVTTGYELDITLTGELIPDVWSTLLAGCFGSGSDSFTSVSGTANHSLVPRPQCPSYSIEEDTDIIPGEQILARQLTGCISDQFQLKATNQSFVQVTSSLIGQKEATPATPGNPSNVNPTFFTTIPPLDFSLLVATYKGAPTTQIMDVTLALMNHTVRVYASNGQIYAARLVPTKREVTMTTLLDFLDTKFYSDWFTTNGVKTSGMVLTFTSLLMIPSTAIPYSWQFTIPGMRPTGEYSPAAASDVIQQNLTWSVTLAGANELSALIVNDEAGALA
jgi:hypothetical protein